MLCAQSNDSYEKFVATGKRLMSLKAGDSLACWLCVQLGKMGRNSFSEEEQTGKHKNSCICS